MHDKELQFLRWLGIGIMGLYALRTLQKQGTLAPALRNPVDAKIKGHNFVDKAVTELSGVIPDHRARELLRTIGHSAVENLTGEE